jgi:hypothetical protein
MSRSIQPLIPLQTAVIGGYVMDEQDSDGTHYNLPRDSDLNFSAILKALRGNTLPSRQHDTQHSEFVSCVGGCVPWVRTDRFMRYRAALRATNMGGHTRRRVDVTSMMNRVSDPRHTRPATWPLSRCRRG